MAKKKMGRPRSERQDVSIKFDRILAGKARQIASAQGMTLVEYLSELTRPLINRDFARVLREAEEHSE